MVFVCLFGLMEFVMVMLQTTCFYSDVHFVEQVFEQVCCDSCLVVCRFVGVFSLKETKHVELPKKRMWATSLDYLCPAIFLPAH